jgi:hypothetical protein
VTDNPDLSGSKAFLAVDQAAVFEQAAAWIRGADLGEVLTIEAVHFEYVDRPGKPEQARLVIFGNPHYLFTTTPTT